MGRAVAKIKHLINRLVNHRRVSLALVLVVLVVASVSAGLLIKNHNDEVKAAHAKQETNLANEAYLKGDTNQALVYAKKALDDEPNNQNAIGYVATLTKSRAESQKLYGQMLAVYKKNASASKPTPITYWAEGNLAAKAGDIAQAKQYYQESITAANSSSSTYYQTIAQRSQTALKELQ